MGIKLEGLKIGEHTICSIDQLDKNTVLLSFDGEWNDDEDGDCVVTEVEYHKDENKWIFEDLYYDKNDDFTDRLPSKRLTQYQKRKVKKMMTDWMRWHDII